MAMKWCTKHEVVNKGVLLCFRITRHISRSHWPKINDLARVMRFWTVTPVWIRQWLRNDAQGLEWHSRCAPLSLQGHLNKSQVQTGRKWTIWVRFDRFRTITPIWIHRWLWVEIQRFQEHERCFLLHAFFPGRLSHTGWEIDDLGTKWMFPGSDSRWDSQMALKCIHKAWIGTEEVSYCFVGVIHNIARSRRPKSKYFDPNWSFPGHN